MAFRFPSKMPGGITLRWYQEEASNAIFDYFEHNEGNPIVAMPTGTGKSLVIADFCRKALQQYPGTRIIKLTHVKELIEQNFKKLLEIWPLAPAGIFSAGLGRREHSHAITYAGIASVAKRGELFGHVDLVLVDECHTLGPDDGTSYRVFLETLRKTNPALKVIGFTATPYRLGQGKLTDPVKDGQRTIPPLFTDTCYDLTNFDAFNRLIAEGWLCPLVPKRTQDTLDVSGVKISAGDFNLGALQLAVDKDSITRAALAELCAAGQDRKHWLIFAAGVEHACHIQQVLTEFGISAVAVHSKLDQTTRDAAIADWKAGRVQAAVNNVVLTTGIDFPGLDLIGDLAPTCSPSRHVQKYGRGTRPFPCKKNCLVLDFAGNTERLGPINDPVMPKRRGEKGKGEAPVRCCPQCGVWNHISIRFCTECGAEFVRLVKYHAHAGKAEILAGEEPIVEIFPVDSVEYSKHAPNDGRPPSLRITFFSSLRRFSTFLCLEHGGTAMGLARQRWREFNIVPSYVFPSTVDEALTMLHLLRAPKALKVWVNKHEGKHPEILSYDWNGRGFGTRAEAV